MSEATNSGFAKSPERASGPGPDEFEERQARRPLVITGYPGGKRFKLDWIESHLPEARRYVEGFGGNATVLLNRRRSEEEYVIERNPDPANMLLVIRDHPQDLIERLRPIRWTENSFKFAKWLLEEGAYDDDVDRAALYYTVLKQSFCGLGGWFNFEWNHNQQRYWDTGVGNLKVIADRLRGVGLFEGDALALLSSFDGPDTLFFLDPPYVRSSRSSGAMYRFEMTDGEHRELCRLIRRLVGRVVLCGYPNPIYDELLGDWRWVSRASFLMIQRKNGPRKRKIEALWMNF